MRFLFPVLALALVASDAQTEERIPLFNGKNLDGWIVEGVKEFQGKDGQVEPRILLTVPVWTANEGLIRCAGSGFGFLRYKAKEFGDFRFHVEYRMAPKCNSGIGVRTGAFDPRQSRASRPSFFSYEIQLMDDAGKRPTVHSTGSLYRYVAPKVSASKPAGEWNAMEITCRGPLIQIVLNDQLIIDVDQSKIDQLKSKPLKGHVCLQNHGGKIDFRQVWIEELRPKSAAR